MRDSDRTVGLYLLSRIDNLKMLDARFEEDIPPARDLYKHSYSGFIWNETVEMSIRYNTKIENHMPNEFSSLEPVISKDGETRTMKFPVFDYEAVCRQLFFFGNDVEILTPPQFREWMIEKLDSAISLCAVPAASARHSLPRQSAPCPVAELRYPGFSAHHRREGTAGRTTDSIPDSRCAPTKM